MTRKLIDLSMPVHNNMVTFPRIVRPALLMYESWTEFAERIGAAEHGVDWLTASYMVSLSDHVGTHIDSLRHLRDDAPGPEGIPLEYCYGDGVVLDFSYKEFGDGISAADIEAALKKIKYQLKALDIVLIYTGAGRINESEDYIKDHCGVDADGTNYLLDHGVKVTGIDAITWDRPVWSMFEHKMFWESHRVMRTREYYHIENMMNLEKLLEMGKPYGFTISVFPVKWVNTTAAPIRAVAIIEE
jgi:kynurenine formamidase